LPSLTRRSPWIAPALVTGLCLLAFPPAGRASAPDSWSAFRADVKAKCVAAARAQGMKSPEALVHPWGTPAFGVAVLVEARDKRICIYDKRAKTAELTPAT
jgi:hypothetical protein